MVKKLKIIRVTTKPVALRILLKDQLKYLNKFHDVVAISSPGEDLIKYRKSENVRTISLNMTRKISPIKDIASLIKMIKILKKERPDIVHSQTPKAGIISMLASILCRVPHRIHTVGGMPLMEANGLKKKILFLVEWLTYKFATRIYPNSFRLKNFILKKFYIPKTKFLVIGNGSSNGIDTNYFKITKKIQEKAKNLKKKLLIENNFIFIFIGRIVKDKGIEELLNVFVKLNDKYKNTKLVLLGWEEKELDPISSQAKKIIKYNKNVYFSGFKEDVRSYLALSNCLVLPSYREGFPNVVLQAGSMKKPSIVSNINGCNEIIKNRINGLLVKPKDMHSLYLSMEKIFLDKQLYKKLSSSARQIVINNFERKFFLKKLLKSYSNLDKKNFR